MNDTQATPTEQAGPPTEQKENEKETWTLMFFLASDNTLSPSTLPQLKAIKAAGHSENAKVVVYFDPNEQGAPTRVFAINEEPDPSVASGGSAGDPVITVLSTDYLTPDDIRAFRGNDSQKFADSLERTDLLQAFEALEQFLRFLPRSISR